MQENQDIEQIIDIETFAKEGKDIPTGPKIRYQIRIVSERYLILMELTLFKGLITGLRLIQIQPLSIHSEKTFLGAIFPENRELTLSWNQAFTLDDPMKIGDGQIMLRPRYEFNAKLGEDHLFKHTSVFGILFAIQDRELVDKALRTEPVRKVFFEKQIIKTMWPILRQHILDGMIRLGLPAIPLPWIVE